MRIRKVLFLIFFLFFSNSINASEIGGIRIFQSAENFIKIDNDEWRDAGFNNDIRWYVNDAFNLGLYSESRDNDFEIPNPDYFLQSYWIWEREKEVIGILTYRPLESKILQQNFKIGECEQLRNQLVLEKEVKFNTEIKKTKTQSYHRSTYAQEGAEENVFYFEDRLSFNYKINGINLSHTFSCYYEIYFEKDADLGKKHLVTTTISEEILETNLLNQYETFYKTEDIEEFNSNYIKNFKIWGNINEIDYDEEEIFSLENYRLKSFQKHNEIKKQNEN